MFTILVIIHVLISGGLILAILLQSGKGADLGAAFGGSSQTLFGSTGAVPFLNKLTTGIAIAFMITSLSLALLASKAPESSIMEGKTQTQQEKPIGADEQTRVPSDTEPGKE
jgi:preprotein translocase subunit SecG